MKKNITYDQKIKNMFAYPRDLIYFDNAAATIPVKFDSDISLLSHGRGMYSFQNNTVISELRKLILNMFNATSHSVFFGLNATDIVNKIALTMSNTYGKFEVLLCTQDHHSTLLPWIILSKHNMVDLKWFNTVSEIEHLITDRTKVISLTHISNVTGYKTCFESIANTFPHVFVFLDASQSSLCVPSIHNIVDLTFFSMHKYFGSTGLGVGIISTRLLDEIVPTFGGGGSIYRLSIQNENVDIVWRDKISCLEFGTQNTCSIMHAVHAIKTLQNLNQIEIENKILSLKQHLFHSLRSIKGITILNQEEKTEKPVVSFYFKGIHSHDIEQLLLDAGICIRTGQHCASLYCQLESINDFIRVSLSVYNTLDEINFFIRELKGIIRLIGM